MSADLLKEVVDLSKKNAEGPATLTKDLAGIKDKMARTPAHGSQPWRRRTTRR